VPHTAAASREPIAFHVYHLHPPSIHFGGCIIYLKRRRRIASCETGAKLLLHWSRADGDLLGRVHFHLRIHVSVDHNTNADFEIRLLGGLVIDAIFSWLFPT
jgi:hypothetical protein